MYVELLNILYNNIYDNYLVTLKYIMFNKTVGYSYYK